MKRALSFILALALVLSLIPAVFATSDGPVTLGQTTLDAHEAATPASGVQPVTLGNDMTKYASSEWLPFSQSGAAATPEADELVTFIVVTKEKPLLSQFSTHDIAAQTSAVLRHEQAQLNVLEKVKTSAQSALADRGDFAIGYTYTIATTGFSVTTAYGNKAVLEALPNVKSVYMAPTFSLPEDGLDQDLEVYTNNASTMIGANVLNDTGYTGKGMRIAILDTGIKVDHPSFAALPDSALADPMTRSSVDDIWDTLNASQMTSALNRSYYNSKLPFVFNYVSGTFDVSNTFAGSDHGTHVAGISAANKLSTTDAVGVAPDAQLVVMQVFQQGGGASWDTIMAALEDCVRLEVDAANLSLGSAAGFVDPAGDMLETLDLFLDSDIQLLIASGNDTNNAYRNNWGLDMSLIDDPDIGLAGTPSTYSAALAVASADNNGYEQMYITVDGRELGYNDTAVSSYTSFISNFRSQTLEYVVVPGVGADDDYAGLDIAGKVALVSRGTISFMEKQAFAQEHGAVACIVYNNSIGVFAMQIQDGAGNIPAVSISQAAGTYMVQQAGNDGIGSFTVCNADTKLFQLDTTISSFSSWGVAPDLTLKPEITGVGGSIYSTVDPAISGSYYGTMSGTSMATPQITGAMAVLIEYLDANYPQITGVAQRKLAADLMMSTADPLMATNDLEYSPRAQGAGLANLVKATTTPAYLSNPAASEGRAKIEFGDDPNKAGVYTFSFTITNLTGQPLVYEIDSSIFTESIYADYFIANSPYALEAKVETSGPVAVPANGSATVKATLTLTQNDKAYLAKFPNGIYVEGFLYAIPAAAPEGTQPVVLSMPVLGFYGDWSAADVFDSHEFGAEVTGNYSLYPTLAYTYVSQLGTNPYFRNGASGDQYNAFSYANPLAEVDFGMLRNAKRLDIKVTDTKTGTVYHSLDGAYMPKTYYNASYGMIIPTYLLADYGELWDGKTADGQALPDGTTVTYSFEAWLDDGDDIVDDRWSFDMTLDNQAPQVINEKDLQTSLRIDEETGRSYLTLTLSDNHYIAALIFTTPDGAVMGKYQVSNAPGQSVTQEYEITGYGSEFVIVVGDYACNETEVEVLLDLGDYGDPVLQPVKLDAGRIYGCETFDNAALESGWFSASKTDFSDPRNETFDSINRYYSAEFVNGYLIAQNTVTGHLELVTPSGTYWGSRVLCQNNGSIGDPGVWVLYDMALDHSGTLSAAFGTNSGTYGSDSLLAVGWLYQGDNDNDGHDDGGNTLFNIKFTDYGTVEVQPLASITGVDTGSELLTLGITTEGQIYGIGTDGILYSVGTSLEWDDNVGMYGDYVVRCSPIGATDFVDHPQFNGANVIQSMGYDHNTGTMYWFAHTQVPNGAYYSNVNVTYSVDLATGNCTEIGTYGPGGQTCLFVPNELESDLFTMGVEAKNMAIDPSQLTMVVGQTQRLKINWSPWNAAPVNVTWASEDDSIVTVDEYGFITAVSSGTVTVSASAELMLDGYWNEDWVWVDPGLGIKTVTCEITVLKSEDGLYGFIAEDYSHAENNMSWVTYSDQDLHAVTKLQSSGTLWYGGTYYNGYIYSVVADQWIDDNVIYSGTKLYRSKVTSGATPAETVIGEPEYIGVAPDLQISALAFDYNTARMYCVENQNVGGLGIIDLDTGEVDMLGLPNGDLYGATYIPGICVTRDGTIVISDAVANLYTIDPDTLTTKQIYNGNGSPYTAYYEAMFYNYNTDTIYWNMCDGNGESPLYLVQLPESDWEMATVVEIGDVSSKNGTQQTILFSIPENEPETQVLPVESIEITNGDTLTGLLGGSMTLDTVTVPARPTIRKRTWTTSDASVVTVDENGTVTFAGLGTATVTASITNKDEATYGGPFTDSIQITVMESAGEFVAFLNSDDNATGYFDFWLRGNDYDLRHVNVEDSMISIYSLRAGTYYDGYYYGYTDKGQFLRIDISDPQNYTILGSANLDYTKYQVTAMAMDYTTGTMFGLTLTSDYDYNNWVTEVHPGELVTIDLNTGALTTVATMDFDKPVYALACDADGQLYAAGGQRSSYASSVGIFKMDKTTGALTEYTTIEGAAVYTGPTYYSNVQFNAQMAYDFGTDRLYLNATVDDQYRYKSYGVYMVELGQDPYVAKLDGISLDLLRGTTKIGEVYLGLLAFIPELDELPVGKVNGIALNKTAGRIILGQTTQLVAQVRPSNAEDTSVTWSSSDPSVAAVDENGLVSGLSLGTATITVTSNETGVTANCVIAVVDASAPQNMAYTVSANKDALIAFNPALPAQTATVVCTLSGGSSIAAMTYGDNCLYYILLENYVNYLYRFDFTTKQSTLMGAIYLFSDATGLAYDKANNIFYATAGFYLFQFDGSALDPTNFNYYSEYMMDPDNCQLTGVVCIDGAVYTFGNDFYSSEPQVMKYSDLYLSDRTVILEGFDMSFVPGSTDIAYEPVSELFYMTDAGHNIFSLDMSGNVTAIDILGDGIDLHGLAIDPVRKYNITYTDGVADQQIFADQLYPVAEGSATPAFTGTPSRTGYTFAGWDPELAETVTGHATYTATWTANTYKITFDANGGEVDGTPIDVVFDTSVGQLPVPSRVGYTFDGWYDEVGNVYTAETVYTAAKDVLLIAEWTANTYTITLDYNDGVTESTTLKVSYGKAYGQLPTPTRVGYTFGGWYDEAGNKVTSQTVFTSTEDVTLTAMWAEVPADAVLRLAGENRYATAIMAADEMKAALNVEKFDTIIIASGDDFADALAGSYLATVKNAPILLSYGGTNPKYVHLDSDNIEYVKNNLRAGGTVYILGGEKAVPGLYEAGLEGYDVQRLGGANRFETNILILEEAGIDNGAEVLVCTATNFADSLSASATGLPILLVWNDRGELYGKQPEFLAELAAKKCSFTILGGENAVSAKLEDTIGTYGKVARLAGKTRMETSVLVAETYFNAPETAVVAYAWNYPDGLCGGSLAHALKAPLILTMADYEDAAIDYAVENGIWGGYVLGGDGLVSDEIVRAIFAMDAEDEIIVK